MSAPTPRRWVWTSNAAVERFKPETPDGSVPLQAPVGVRVEDDPTRSPRIVAAPCVVVIAVVGWNVVPARSA